MLDSEPSTEIQGSPTQRPDESGSPTGKPRHRAKQTGRQALQRRASIFPAGHSKKSAFSQARKENPSDFIILHKLSKAPCPAGFAISTT